MTIKRSIIAGSILAGLLSSSAAFAVGSDWSPSTEISQLKTLVMSMQKQIDRLEKGRTRGGDTDSLASLQNKVDRLENDLIIERTDRIAAEFGRIEPASGVSAMDMSGIIMTMDPTPAWRSKDGEFSFRPFGKLQADVAFFSDDIVDNPDDADLRRARFGFAGNVSRDWEYVAELDLAGSTTTANNVSLTYTGIDDVKIRVGHFTPSFIMEETADDARLMFLERSISSSAWGTGELFGLAVHTGGDNWTFNTGIHGDKANTDASTTDDEQWSTITRATFAPILESDKVLHLGAGVSYRVPKSRTVTFGAATNAIQATANISTGAMTDVDDYLVYNVEAAGVMGPFSLQGEYIATEVNRNVAADADFSGWYVQASYFLTGESRNYGGGQFHAVTPRNDFSASKGGIGAWEISARFSNLDLNDGAVAGGEMDDWTVGLSWYLNRHLRFTANYIAIDTDANAVVANDDPELLIFRTQVTF